jgi:hypothetical protein
MAKYRIILFDGNVAGLWVRFFNVSLTHHKKDINHLIEKMMRHVTVDLTSPTPQEPQ